MSAIASVQLPRPNILATLLYERDGLWQFRLEDQKGLDSFCRDRGLSSMFMGKHAAVLWSLGWLLADIIRSPSELLLPGMALIASDSEGYIYADERVPQPRLQGWVGAASGLQTPSKVTLLFHPYRYYVVYRIQRLLKLTTSPMQMLYKPELYPKSVSRDIDSFSRSSSKADFHEAVLRWNQTAAIAILSEPCVHQKLFGVLRFPFGRPVEEQSRLIDAHWKDVSECIRGIGVEELEKRRSDLCVSAEMLDPNKDVHTLLRLTQGEMRVTHIRGRLGGAICLLAMAETIRRATECTFDTELKEEDELGFGMIPSGVKEREFGSERPLDAPMEVKNQFLRTLGLDYGTIARWYVEGDTEYGAIRSVMGSYHGVELVNLRGNVSARSGKGLTFRDDLRSDLIAHRFSFISLDGDRSDYLKAAKKAAQAEEICGAFFVSVPDFEFANFTLPELCLVLLSVAGQDDSLACPVDHVAASLGSVTSARAFVSSIRRLYPDLTPILKGEQWGASLMRHAWAHPEGGHLPGAPAKRPIVRAVEMASGAATADYIFTRREFRVDPQTGQPVPRTAANGVA